jgi:peptidyl-prolyl cis-trans isomerase SurA
VPRSHASPKPASLLAVAVLALAPAGLSADVVNRVVLRVNDQIATLYDYQERKREFVGEIARREQDAEERRRLISQSGQQVFKDMYDELLLQSRADQLGVEITDEQIDRAAAQMRQSYGLTTDEEFRAALAQSGLSEAKLREQIRANLRLREVLGREVNSKIKLEEDDLRRYYRSHTEEFRVPEQVSLREVVVLAEKVPAAEERQRIAGEIARAVAGGKTLEQAIEPYKAEGVTSGVIDLGRVSHGDLDPDLEAAAWKLERGAVSAPVEGRGGLHLLQVADRHPSYVKQFSEVSAQINEKENERLYREKLVDYMAKLRAESLVVANPPPDAAGYESLLGTEARTTDEFNVGRASSPQKNQQPVAPPASGTAAAQPEVGEDATAVPAAPDLTPGQPGALPEPKPVDPAEPAPAVPPPVEPPPPPPA